MMKNNFLHFIIFVLFICVGVYMFVGIGSKSGYTQTEINEATTTDIVESSTNDTPKVNIAVKNTVKKSSTNITTSTTKNTTNKTTSAINYTKIGQRVLMNGVYVTPTKVTYDSRCPVDVKCIQAGTVELGVLMESGSLSQNVIIILNKPFVFAEREIILNSVTPSKYSGKTIQEGDYRFSISVK